MDIQVALQKISLKQNLTDIEMTSLMRKLFSGDFTEAQIGAFILGLRSKGETITELTAAAKVMRELSVKVNFQDDLLLDTCGTGGVSSGIFNVSTASALLLASCGVKIAKHGNRTVTRKSGSADLLEEAGVNLNLSPEQIKICIEKIGIGFMFAPSHHNVMKHVMGPRKEIGIKTIFNVLGPLTNPAEPLNQIMGVYKKELLIPIIEVLRSLGSKRAMVVHSEDGLDEISIVENTHIAELKDGIIREYIINPKDFDVNFNTLEPLKVYSPKESLVLVKEGLTGKNKEASAMIALNSGAGFYLVGMAQSLEEGIKLAKNAISSKKGLFKLDELVSLTNELISKNE